MDCFDEPLVGLVTLWYRASATVRHRFISDLAAVRYTRLLHVFVIQDQQPFEVDELRSSVPRAVILEPPMNLGTAAGWNRGIRRLLAEGADYIGTWNVDVRPDPDWLRHLIGVMHSDLTIGAAQPLLLFSDAPNMVQMFGGSIDVRSGLAVHEFRGTTELDRLPLIRDAQYLDGGTMIARSSALRAVGGFDEDFFLYTEDCDLSIRLRKRGFRLVAIRDARAWHYHRELIGALPAPHEMYYASRNRFLLVRKHGYPGVSLRLVAQVGFEMPRRVAYFLRRRAYRQAWAYLVGTVAGIAGRTGKSGWVD
jgi:GT2 family glycosyltransferase